MTSIFLYPDGTEGPARHFVSQDGQLSIPAETLLTHKDNVEALAAFGVIFLREELPDPAEAAHAQAYADILAELAQLDTYMPRGLEDICGADPSMKNKLSQFSKDRLARKGELRAILASQF